MSEVPEKKMKTGDAVEEPVTVEASEEAEAVTA